MYLSLKLVVKGKIVQENSVILPSPQFITVFHSDRIFLSSCFLLQYFLNLMSSWQAAIAIPSLHRAWTLATPNDDHLTGCVLVHIAGLFLDIKAQQVLVGWF